MAEFWVIHLDGEDRRCYHAYGPYYDPVAAREDTFKQVAEGLDAPLSNRDGFLLVQVNQKTVTRPVEFEWVPVKSGKRGKVARDD